MPRVRFHDFRGGLFLTHSRDEVPANTLFRARGIRNPALTRSLRSRFGSQVIETIPLTRMHSIVTWHHVRYYGGWNSAFTGFGTTADAVVFANNHKLTFASGIPTAGKGRLAAMDLSPEHLFIAGGGRPTKIRDGFNATRWGIQPPAVDPFITFEAKPFQLTPGFNYKFWETFNLLGDGGPSPIYWGGMNDDHDVNVTISTTTVPPDNQSTACLQLDIADGHYAVVERAMTGPDGNPRAQDFRTFGTSAGGDGPPSADQDWIVLDVMIDHPEAIESFQLNFGSMEDPVTAAAGLLDDEIAVCTHTREIIVDDPVVRKQQQQPFGVGDIAQIRDDQAALVDEDKGPSSTFIRQAVDAMANDRLSSVAGEWRRLKIPKSSFTITNLPPGQEPWERITLWQFVVRTRELDRVQRVNIYIDNGSLFGGTGMQGDYKYLVTYKNNLTGSRSNPNEEPVVVKSVFRNGVELSGIPQSDDPQVQAIEIWRTQGNGSIYFLCATIPAQIRGFIDNVADYRGLAQYPLSAIRPGTDDYLLDVLQNEEVEFDNIPPPDTMEDVVGPHLGRLFGTRDTAPGAGGRVYYTVPGKLEAWPDWIEVSTDDDPMQKLVIAAGSVYAFSQKKVWEILGDGPFLARELFGCPGTLYPFSVVNTPYGIIYLSHDGVRVMNGATSQLVAPEPVLTLFRGEDAVGLNAFPATTDPQLVCAEFWKDEYFLTDSTQTLAVNLASGCWRDVGASFRSMYHEQETDKLLVGRVGDVLDWEVPGLTQDAVPIGGGDGDAIPFHLELPAVRPDAGLEEFVFQRFYVDINTNNAEVDLSLFANEGRGAVQGGIFTVSTPWRRTVEISLCAPGGVSYVRFDANLIQEVELFGFELDVHVPVNPNAT